MKKGGHIIWQFSILISDFKQTSLSKNKNSKKDLRCSNEKVQFDHNKVFDNPKKITRKYGAIHNHRHVKPKTHQTPDSSNLRHIKPQTHQTSDKEYRATNYTTDKNTFLYFKWKSDLFSSFQIGFQLKYEKVFLSVV